MVGRDTEITVDIVQAVADRKNADPLELEPLNDVVDTEALERLFPPTSWGGGVARGCVQFVYEGQEVTVHSDGEIEVEEWFTNRGYVSSADTGGNV